MSKDVDKMMSEACAFTESATDALNDGTGAVVTTAGEVHTDVQGTDPFHAKGETTMEEDNAGGIETSEGLND